MVSSKGKPTDPKLREEAKEDVKQMPNKDGGGKGHMAGWKAGKISEEYEKRGGGYENEAGSKNEPTKGAPIPKSDAKKDAEVKENGEEKSEEKEKEKPKANSGKKATGTKKAEPKAKAPKKEKKPPAEGTRKSSRVAATAGTKRSAPEDDDDDGEEEEKKEKKKAPAKKAKTSAKK